MIVGNFKVEPNKITHYYTSAIKQGRSRKQVESQTNLKSNRATEISKKAKSNITAKINWLIAQAEEKTYFAEKAKKWYKFRINFITLTLSATQIHDDRKIKSVCLNYFLNEVRRRYKVKNYLWRAERQKNGNIHFHITTDKYIHWNEIRKIWNAAQARLGYLERFFDTHGHRNPNSTDVHSVLKIKNLAAYLTKYLTKNDPTAKPIEGRQWYISQSLARFEPLKLEEDEVSYNEIKEALKEGQPKRLIKLDFATIYIDKWHSIILNSPDSQINDDYRAHLEKFKKGTKSSP